MFVEGKDEETSERTHTQEMIQMTGEAGMRVQLISSVPGDR